MQEPWHIDRKVPVAIFLAIAVQGGGSIWWASRIDARLSVEVDRNARQDEQIEALGNETQGLQVGAASVAAQLVALNQSMVEVKAAQKETNDLLRALASGAKE